MAYQWGDMKYGQGYWVDRFMPTPSTTVIQGGGSGANTRQTFAESPDGLRTSFTLPSTPSATNLELFRNGLLLTAPDDYSINGSTVTFTVAPATGDALVAYYGGGSSKQTVSGTIDGVNTIFTLPSSPSSVSLQLFKNGMLQLEGVGNDYTLSGNQLTLTPAPSVGDTLVAYF